MYSYVQTVSCLSLLKQRLTFLRHYDLPHHGKPQPPEDQSGRAARLYTRNLEKFNKDIEAKYAIYRQSQEAQQLLVNKMRDVLYPSTEQFHNLIELDYHSGSLCPHYLSRRFRQRYIEDCAIPQSDDPKSTVWQLERLLRPGLRSLHMSQISPRLFDGEGIRTQQWLSQIFASLQKINIGFRQERIDSNNELVAIIDSNDDEPVLTKGNLLPHALRQATNLDFLQINFMPNLRASAAALENIMPTIRFERLARLDLDYFTCRAEELLRLLKAQPKLYWLALSNVTLSKGTWVSLGEKMRQSLHLEEFVCAGYLEDPTAQYMTGFCSRDEWSMRNTKRTLAMALDCELTNHKNVEDRTPDEDGEEEAIRNSFIM